MAPISGAVRAILGSLILKFQKCISKSDLMMRSLLVISARSLLKAWLTFFLGANKTVCIFFMGAQITLFRQPTLVFFHQLRNLLLFYKDTFPHFVRRQVFHI